MASDWWQQQRFLILAPHPDDEVIGCGGLMAKAKANGAAVYVLFFTVGNRPLYGAESHAPTRLAEAEQVMKHLQVDGYDFFQSYETLDRQLDLLPQRDLMAFIERESRVAMNAIGATVVALPALQSYHQDHAAVARAGFAACRPRPHTDKPFPSLVLCYDHPDLCWNTDHFRPNFYIEVQDYLETKLAALALYASQVHPEPHPISLDNVRRLAQLRGAEICIPAAEAFQAYRILL